jgi:hypothetical protein
MLPKEEPITNIKPHINPQRTLVDGLVDDYLHYAQYGHIIPVYEGTGTLSCSCCTDRNRENVRTILLNSTLVYEDAYGFG